jgi:hypothetical protein
MKEKGWMKKMKNKDIDNHQNRILNMKPLVDASAPRKPVTSKRREMIRVCVHSI